MKIEVHKFGGTSVGSSERIAHLVTCLEARADATGRVVVVSAMSGVTDQLIDAARLALSDRGAARAAWESMAARHRASWNDVAPAGELADALDETLDVARTILDAVHALGELPPAVHDRLLACGEKLSARLVAAAFRARGVEARAVDADTFLETDARHGEASPLPGLAALGVRAHLVPLLEDGVLPVVTGFCGRSPAGRTTTLGRGGSDFTATILGGALRCDAVWIWTDIDGVYTADPRAVPGATAIPQLNYREAAELAFFGAKVLHPRTLEPVASAGIPVRIVNTFAPDAEGTIVDARLTPGSHPVKGLSAVRRHSLLSLEGRGIAGVPGAAARMFGALARADVSVTMISQSNAESSITVAVPTQDGERAERELRGEFRLDLAHGLVGDIVARPSVGLVAAVGIGMANAPGISARVFGALARDGINVLAIAQGSSELNISLAVEDRDTLGALRALHDEFGLALRDTGVEASDGADLIVHGLGSVARRVIELIEERHDDLHRRTGLDLRVVAVTDRGAIVSDPRGLSAETLATALRAKTDGESLASVPTGTEIASHHDALAALYGWRLRRPVFLDLSSDDTSAALFAQALAAGADVVTANKWPLAGDETEYRRLMREAARRRRTIRFEATVGAGLPVHDTIEMLRATGDRIHSIAGCLSGTLSWVLEQVSRGTAFSDAVLEAKRRGYTETDPVLDLVGGDVARKVMIAARAAGLPLTHEQVSVEPLVEPALLGCPASELRDRLRAWDAPIGARVEDARSEGRVPRYVGRVEAGRATVGLEMVDASSPLFGIEGTDNRIVIHSERYRDRPLSVTGPGAGVDVTAMGVLGDLIRVLTSRRSA